MNWFIASLIAIFCWGIWGLLVKEAAKFVSWEEILIVSSLASVATVCGVFIITRPSISIELPGFGFSFLAGLIMIIGTLAFYSALQEGEMAIVVPLTALYPIVTVLLSYLILSEKISLLQGVGVILALVAIFLLSLE